MLLIATAATVTTLLVLLVRAILSADRLYARIEAERLIATLRTYGSVS